VGCWAVERNDVGVAIDNVVLVSSPRYGPLFTKCVMSEIKGWLDNSSQSLNLSHSVDKALLLRLLKGDLTLSQVF
jgi:hypothetical protein